MISFFFAKAKRLLSKQRLSINYFYRIKNKRRHHFLCLRALLMRLYSLMSRDSQSELISLLKARFSLSWSCGPCSLRNCEYLSSFCTTSSKKLRRR